MTFGLFKFCIDEAVTTDESLGLIMLLENMMEDYKGYVFKWIESQGEGFDTQDKFGTEFRVTSIEVLYEVLNRGVL